MLNLDAIGAGYQSDDAWFGESESFLGGPVDRWAEFGVEPTLSFETRAGRGKLFASLSGVYTSTSPVPWNGKGSGSFSVGAGGGWIGTKPPMRYTNPFSTAAACSHFMPPTYDPAARPAISADAVRV